MSINKTPKTNTNAGKAKYVKIEYKIQLLWKVHVNNYKIEDNNKDDNNIIKNYIYVVSFTKLSEAHDLWQSLNDDNDNGYDINPIWNINLE